MSSTTASTTHPQKNPTEFAYLRTTLTLERHFLMKPYNHEFPSCFSFELLFENNHLTGISAHIILRCSSKDEAGTTYLTPDCATPEELHYQINRLTAELERLRTRGMKHFIEAINGSKRKKTS